MEKKRMLNSVVARKIAETVTQPIEEMTDRIALNALLQRYEDIIEIEKHSFDNRALIHAVQDREAVKTRLLYLNRLKITTPPVTPQLNLF